MSEPFLGEIIMFAGNFAPRGWALCNGQILSIAQNTALFSILGTTYGGNGQTTFALPDFRGRVPVSQGQGPGLSAYDLGEVTGVENTTLLINQMPAHNHTATVTINPAASPLSASEDPTNAVPAGGSQQSIYASAPDGTTKMNAGMATATIAPAGGSQPFSIIQPLLCVNFIIAIQGIFPSRN
jgi:microcystin-dependent protein